MKTVLKIFLILLFIPLFLIGILLSNVKFQVLNTDFWLTTFEKNNVYQNLAVSLKKASETKIEKEGADAGDATILTDLITPANIKDVFVNNVTNLLNFINGRSQSFDVYIPIGKIPKEILPASIGSKPDTIPIAYFLRTFNITNITESDIMMISNTGLLINIILVIDAILILFILFLMFLATGYGKRLWAPSTAFLISGTITLVGFAFGETTRRNMVTLWPKNLESIKLIFSPFAPFVIERIILVWLIAGLVCLVLGILLFFVKRPVYNIRK